MTRPPSVIIVALMTILISSVFIVNGLGSSLFLGHGIDSIFSTLGDQQSLLPKANALQKDLLLDVSPQLHPDILAGQAANEITLEHFNDPDIHCEDCLRMVIPNIFDLSAAQKGIGSIGAAFSNNIGYNFEGATKARFYVMSEQEGVKLRFMAAGNDVGNEQTSTSSNSASTTNKELKTSHQNTLFKNQRFAVISGTVAPKHNIWNYFEMGVSGIKGLDNIKYPFAFEVMQGGSERNTILYLKGVSYSDEPTLNRFLLNSSLPIIAGNLTNTGNSTILTTSPNNNSTNATTLSTSTTDNNNNTTISAASSSSVKGNNPSASDKVIKDNATDTSSSSHASEDAILLQPQVQNRTLIEPEQNGANTAQANNDNAIVHNDRNTANSTILTTSPNNNSTNATTLSTSTTDNNNNTTISAASSSSVKGNNPSASDKVIKDNATDTSSSSHASEDAILLQPQVQNRTLTHNGSNVTQDAHELKNNSPIADAGKDVTVDEGTRRFFVDGTNSFDKEDGTKIAKYIWKQIDGPEVKLDTTSHPGQAIFDVPFVRDNNIKLVFELTVIDTQGAHSQNLATVSIKINDLGTDPQVVSYWENNPGNTSKILSIAAQNGEPILIGNYTVPTDFELPKISNDAKSIFAAGITSNNAYEKLAAQLLAAKLNTSNKVPSCETITTTMHDADKMLKDAGYGSPKSLKSPSGEEKDHALQLIKNLNYYNIYGCH